MASVESVKDACGGIQWIEPSSPDYAEARKIFQMDNTAVPLAIVRPKSDQEVATIVNACKIHGVKFTIKVGGHQLAGKAIEQDALTICLRNFNSVQVAPDHKSAIVGGGCLSQEVAQALHAEGLVTPLGTLGSVGYVGWAMYGGYGSLMNHFGLGVDQILGAEVVNSDGQIIEADEELLKAIRGGGGNFGIITSMKIKVYSVKTMLMGILVFDSEDLPQTYKTVLKIVQKKTPTWPSAVQMQPSLLNFPPNAQSVICLFVWSSPDHSEGRRVLSDFISSAPPIVMNTVSETAHPTFLEQSAALGRDQVHGEIQTVTIRQLDDPDILRVLSTTGAETFPRDPTTSIFHHTIAAHCPSVDPDTSLPSVFPLRYPHTMLEIIGVVQDEANREVSASWTTTLRDELRATGKAETESYISLTCAGTRTLEQVYGKENWAELKRLKDKFDPEDVFDLAVPRMKSGVS